MDLRVLAGLGGAALGLIGYPRYLRGVAKSKVRPALASWCAWWCSAAVVLGGQIAAMSGWAMALTAAQLVGLGSVIVVSLRRLPWRPTRLDVVGIATCVSGAVLSISLSDPSIAVAAAISGNIVAGVPTYRSVLRHPAHEDPGLWLCAAGAGGLAALSAPTFDIAGAGYGIYLLAANLTIGVAALRATAWSSALVPAARSDPDAVGVHGPDEQRPHR